MIAIVTVTIIIVSQNFLATKLEEALLPLSHFGFFFSHITWTVIACNAKLNWPCKNLSLVAGPWPLLTWPGVISSFLLEKLREHNEPVLCSRCPSALSSVNCKSSDSWQWGKALAFFRERNWISAWPKWPLPGMALPTGRETGHSEMKQRFSSLQKSLGDFLAHGVACTSRGKCHEKGSFYGMWPPQQDPPEFPWLRLFPAASLPSILLFPCPVFFHEWCSCSPSTVWKQNLGETFGSLLVWGTHPLLCWNQLNTAPRYTLQQLQGIATILGACCQ